MSADSTGPSGELLLVRCPDEGATEALGAAIGTLLGPGDLVCLHGDLGAGKTRLVRGIARGVGVDAALVSSPTFVIVHDYPTARAGSPGLVHVDAYRLRGPDELDSLGWDRVTGGAGAPPEDRQGAGGVPPPASVTPPLVIEWPERIEGALPQPAGGALRMDVAIGVESATSREVELRGPAAWTSRPGWDALARLAGVPAGRTRRCPTCFKPVTVDGAFVPFCSDRCRMADLGRWFSGSYSVSREIKPEDVAGEG